MSNSDDLVPIEVTRERLDALVELIGSAAEHDERIRQAAHEAGYAEGRAVKIGNGYETGYDLGYDTGASFRQDTRAYLHGILDGWERGCADRQQLAEDLIHGMAPKREPEGQHQPELEAEDEPECDDLEAAS